MSEKIDKLFETTAGLLVFALLSGCGDFFFVLMVIIIFPINGVFVLG